MFGETKRASVWVAVALLLPAIASGAFWLRSRQSSGSPTIAFIPQTAGAMLWDVEHLGASSAADQHKLRLYWNAPTSENDVAGQASVIERVGRGKYQGLVLAPDHTLATLTPLRRVLAAGLPVVVVSAQLDLPPSGRLSYIVNDDEKMGELAVEEVARLLHGKGYLALVGLARYGPGVATRVRSAEALLAAHYPDIQVVGRVAGTYDSSRSEDLTTGILSAHPELNAVLSFTAVSTRGVHAALKSRSLQHTVRLVGCEQDADLIGFLGAGEIAALVGENTYRMGFEAVGQIADSLAGKPVRARSVVAPLLITKANLNTAEVSPFTSVAR